ncbi:DUF4214 domain-containing protein [Duganella qianjiadongensis]|uniref:DUF4214 domain-containing protein n=1 Tax=Duganella qianjiadongensis TaxID=2692176 RepID=A0ABW9VJH0_9BURK|nr:DUF4214 domain-containing protein [Duganella qianjiadongensis]MYM39462.1 DUF4214 domain-containing protein [Duganella qianjiadongensis]
MLRPHYATCLSLAAALFLAGCGGDQTATSGFAGTARKAQGSATVSPTVYESALQQIYVGYFGRPADPAGLLYYERLLRDLNAPTDIPGLRKAYDSNPSIAQVIDSFGNSQESNDLYPGSTDEFITAIYRNLFNREPDASGKAFWVGVIQRGAITRANAVLSLMAGALSTDLDLINKKTRVAADFTNSLTSTATVNAYSGISATASVRDALSKVSNNSDTAADQARMNGVTTVLTAGLPLDQQTQLLAGAGGLVQKSDGTTWAWGLYALVVNGATTPTKISDTPYARLYVAGNGATFAALAANGDLYMWGDNSSGQFGPNKTAQYYLSPVATGLIGFSDISIGGATLAVSASGQLGGWGYNGTHTILGAPATDHIAPTAFMDGVRTVLAGANAAIRYDGSLVTWGPDYLRLISVDGTALITSPMTLATNVKQAAAGASFYVILKNDGTLWTLGRNLDGQLGDGSKVDYSTAARQIGSGYIAVAAGTAFGMALKADHTLWTWGSNYFGQLGDGSTTNQGQPVKVLDHVVSIAAGAYHALALKDNGTIWAWGRNEYYELGDGSKAQRNAPVLVFDTAPGKCAGGVAANSGRCPALPDPNLVCQPPSVKQNGQCVILPPPPPTCAAPAQLINSQCIVPGNCAANEVDVGAGQCVPAVTGCNSVYVKLNQCASPNTNGDALRITYYGPTTARPSKFGDPLIAYLRFNLELRPDYATATLKTAAGKEVPASVRIENVPSPTALGRYSMLVTPQSDVQGDYILELNPRMGPKDYPAATISTDQTKLSLHFDRGFTVAPVGVASSDPLHVNYDYFDTVVVDFLANQMDASTLGAGAIQIYNVTDDKPATVLTNVSSNRLIAAPTGGFLSNTAYRATLGTTVKTKDGKHLSQPYSWEFTSPPPRPGATCPIYTSIASSCGLIPNAPPTTTPGGGAGGSGGTGTTPVTSHGVTATSPNSGSSGASCLRFSQGVDDRAWKITNTCSAQVYIMTCHDKSALVPGSSGGICASQPDKLFYTHTWWIDPGQTSENYLTTPFDSNIWYGACIKVGSKLPSASVVDNKGHYYCKE